MNSRIAVLARRSDVNQLNETAFY